MHMACRSVFNVLIASLTFFLISTPAISQFLSPALPGASAYEGWSDLTVTRLGVAYGTYPGATPWPAPIDPNEPSSSGHAEFNKTAGPGYPAGTSIYSPITGGTFVITSNSGLAISDVETVVFQIDLGAGSDAFNADPVLNYNGGSQSLAADFTATADGRFTSTNPNDPSETGLTTIYQYQWDFSGVTTEPVTEYQLLWTTGGHAQTYAMQVDVGDTFAQVVPEPTSLLLMLGGVLGLAGRTRRGDARR